MFLLNQFKSNLLSTSLFSSAIIIAGLFGLYTLSQPSTAEATGNYCSIATTKQYLKAAPDTNSTNYTKHHLDALYGFYMNQVNVKNTHPSCTMRVGLASYKAFVHYQVDVTSQEYFASKTVTLKPGHVFKHAIAIPDCTYQVDLYTGEALPNFLTGTYTSQGRYLAGWYFPGNPAQQGKLPTCVKTTPTPTPTPTVTPTPSPTPSPTPTTTPTPTSTPTPVPTDKMPTPCPTGTVKDNGQCGQVESATPTPTPPAELPSTGPGMVTLISLVGMTGGLIYRKYKA